MRNTIKLILAFMITAMFITPSYACQEPFSYVEVFLTPNRGTVWAYRAYNYDGNAKHYDYDGTTLTITYLNVGYDNCWGWMVPNGDWQKRTPNSPISKVKCYWNSGFVPWSGTITVDVSFNDDDDSTYDYVVVMPNSGGKPW